MHRKINLLLLLGVLLTAAWWSPVSAQKYYFAMLLRGGGYQTNVIYAVDATTGQVVPYSWRLRNALPSNVTAESLSMGLDGTDYEDPHGLLLFTLEKPTGSANVGALNSAVFWEHPSELHADVFGVPHRPEFGATSPTLNIKVVEENSATLPPVSNWYLPLPSFGLAGAFTGTPTSANPPDLVGLDYHLAPRKEPIYFSVNIPFSIGGGPTFYPSDILYLDSQDQIKVWQSHTDMLIHQDDRIDGLSLCLRPAPGVNQNAVLALDPGPSGYQTQTQTPLRTVDHGDLLLYVVNGAPKLRLWRDAPANGLQLASAPDVDGVVSIDPKRLLPGSSLSGIPSQGQTQLFAVETYYYELSSEMEVLTNYNWSEIEPTVFIEWDFTLTPPGVGKFSIPALQDGDEELIEVHFLNSGIPRSYYEVYRQGPSILPPHPGSWSVQGVGPFASIFIPALAAQPSFDLWELIIAGQTPETFTSQNWQLPVQLLRSLPGDPGPKLLELRAKDTINNKRSNGLQDIVVLDSTVAPPTDLHIEKVDATHVTISWVDADITGATTRVEVSGVQDSTISLPNPLVYTGSSPQTFFVGDKTGYHGVKLTTVTSGQQKSLPLEGSFFTGIARELHANRTLPASGTTYPFTPGDLALEDSTANLVMVPKDGGTQFWTADTLDHNGGSPDMHPFPLSGTSIHGVTSYLESTLNAAGDPEVVSHLLFLAYSASGTPQLIVTEPQMPFTVEHQVDVLFGVQPNTLGAIAVEPESDQILLVANGRLHFIDGAQNLMQVSSVPAFAVPTLMAATVSAVSCRSSGYYEVPVSDGNSADQHTHLLTLDSSHQVVSSLELANPALINGMVQAHDPLPTTYIAVGNQVDTFEMPKQVDPSGDHLFNTSALPFDLDGNGDPLDANDWTLFLAVVAAWQNGGPLPAIPPADFIMVPASWDVDGTELSFPGNGQITLDDLVVIYIAFTAQGLPNLVCVPVHPAWNGTTTGSCD